MANKKINQLDTRTTPSTTDLLAIGDPATGNLFKITGSSLAGTLPINTLAAATGNVTLGEYGLTTGYNQFDLTPTQAGGVGRLIWNDTDGTLDLGLKGGLVTLQIGQEEVVRVVNKTGSTLNQSAYQVVKVSTAQGQRLGVALAQGNNDANSADTLGLVSETISNNAEGFITISGIISGINTTGSLQSETWADGDLLFLSPTTAGAVTNIRPVAPDHTVILGYVVYAHATQGKIFVKVDNGYELDELHNVKITTPTNGQVLKYNSTLSVWENSSDAGVTSIAMTVPTGLTISGSPITSSGTLGLSFTAGYSIPTTIKQSNWDDAYTFVGNFPTQTGQSGKYLTTNGSVLSWATVTNGTVTSVGLTTGTTGTDISVTGSPITSSGSFTLNIPTASATNRGALSSTDWTTFNNKLSAAVTSLNSLTASSQTFATGTSGTDFNISSATNLHTFNIPTASATNRGALSSSDWSTFNSKQSAITLTTTGSSGAATFITNTLNIPTYTLSGLGGVPTSRTLTINGTSFDLSADRSWTISTAISIGSSITSATTGSILFAGTSGVLSQDNTNLFWDNTNKRLGLGINTPTSTFDVNGAVNFAGSVTGTGNTSNFTVTASGGIARSKRIISTLVAAANNDILVGLDLSVNTTLGSFTGLQQFAIRTASTFAPTSGNTTMTSAAFTPTINQTGGANGITRGLHINPTLTAAADYRSIEWSNNSGWGLYGLGTSANYLNGILQLGSTTSTGERLQVTGTTRITGNTQITGDVTIDGNLKPRMAFNRQTASYTLVLTDEGKTVEMNVATANNLTVPLNSSVAFPIGTQILISQYGAGQTTIVATGGVTLRSDTNKLKIATQYSGATLIKVGTDEWYVFGNLTA